MALPAWLCTSTLWPRRVSSATASGVRPTRLSCGLISLGTPISISASPEAVEQVERQREDNGGILVHGDRAQRLHVAQLHGARLAAQYLGGLHELFRSLQFALGVNDL